MLVLTRKTTETIKIGDEIEVTVTQVKGKTVRLAVKAPREMKILRGELKPLVSGLRLAERKAVA